MTQPLDDKTEAAMEALRRTVLDHGYHRQFPASSCTVCQAAIDALRACIAEISLTLGDAHSLLGAAGQVGLVRLTPQLAAKLRKIVEEGR